MSHTISFACQNTLLVHVLLLLIKFFIIIVVGTCYLYLAHKELNT